MSRRLPPGLFDYGAELAAAVDCRLDEPVVGDAHMWIDMPRRLGTADTPSQPVRWGDGALCVDLGPDDVETWDRFAEVHRCKHDPEAVAAAAQEWRLPVTPYRRLPPAAPERDATAPGPRPSTSTRVEGTRIVDLTSMWAGPLCTELLGRAGAEVVKVDSSARPDGLRGTAMHRELNGHKRICDLDLRDDVARRCFDELLGSADLLVTSLSPRALANLNLLPAHLEPRHDRLRTLAITAFEPSLTECDWIAYGTGVHATSGLGWMGDEPQTPTFSYPDPLAGLLATGVALDQLSGTAPQHQRVSLAGAVAPLAARAARAASTGGSRV